MRPLVPVLLLVALLVLPRAAAAEPPARGATTPTAEVVLFADLSDTAAGNAFVVLDAFAAAHTDKVRLVFRHRPKADDAHADVLHRVLAGAHAQQRFWELARLVAANQDRIGYPDLLGMALQAGLDPARLAIDANDPASAETVAEDVAEAVRREATGPVRVFVNGHALTVPVTRAALEAAIRATPSK